LAAPIDGLGIPETAHPDGSLILCSHGATGGLWKLGVVSTRDGTLRYFDPKAQVVPPIATERQINVVRNWQAALAPSGAAP
jgi:hypothetical protein